MTYSEVMISSILIMFGTIFALIVMAFIISKRRNRNVKPVYADTYNNPEPVQQNEIKKSRREPSERVKTAEVRFQTSVEESSKKRRSEEKRVIRSDRNMKAVRESSYSDPRFHSVRAPRFRVVNSTLLS